MIFTRPFITRQFIDPEVGDLHKHELSIAFRPIDEFTHEQPTVSLRVTLKEIPNARAIRNQSGFFCFEEIPAGDYTLLLEPDRVNGDWFYLKPDPGQPWTLSFERSIRLLPNSLLEFPLTFSPNPSYPFPANATLLRGVVTQGTPAGVSNAVVTAIYDQANPADPILTIPTTVQTLTNQTGEYVLFFENLAKPVSDPIKLTAQKDGSTGKRDDVVITEGKTNKATIDLTV
jgi:hypothetical protein